MGPLLLLHLAHYILYFYFYMYTGTWPFQVYCPGMQLKSRLHPFVCLKTIVQTIYSAQTVHPVLFAVIYSFYLLMSLNMILLWFWSILVHFCHICHCPVRFSTQTDRHMPLLFYCLHTLIEVKPTISDRFNCLQLHNICRRCLWTSSWCDYCPILHKFFTLHCNFAKILIMDSLGNVNEHVCDVSIHQ